MPSLRNSPAIRSTSKVAKRMIFRAELPGGVDTAAGSLAFQELLRGSVARAPPPARLECKGGHIRVRIKGRSAGGFEFKVKSRRRGARATAPRGYNHLVSAVSPPPPDRPAQKRPPKSHIYKVEAAGILIIGTVVLILILTRYWHHIAWGVR